MNNNYMSKASNIIIAVRRKLQQSKFLSYSYIIFLTGFFIAPDNHLHRNFFYLFIVVPFLIQLDSDFIHYCIRSKLLKLSILFLLYFGVSMFWTDIHLSGEEYYDQARYFLMLVIFIVATMMLSSASEAFFDEIKFWLGLVALVAAIGFILIFYATHGFPQERLSGPFDYTQNPNQAAMFFGFAGILVFHSFISSTIKLQKFFYFSVLLTTIVYILLCQSRGPLLAMLCSIILVLIIGKRWKAVGTFMTICAGFIVLAEFLDIGVSRFIERGFSFRIDTWLGALKRIAESPILGEGYFTDVNMKISSHLYSPHNVLLLIMVKSGIVGSALFLILILAAFAQGYKIATSGNWIYVSLLVYFVVCMTVDSAHLLYKPSLAWFIFWLPVGLMAGEEIRLKNLAPEKGRSGGEALRSRFIRGGR